MFRIGPSCVLALFVFFPASLQAQTGTLAGIVTDSATRAPLSGTTVQVVAASGAEVASAVTTARGRFRLRGLPAGDYTLLISRLGFEDRRIEGVELAAGETMNLAVVLTPLVFSVDPIVVTVSRSAQTALDAPAAVSVVTQAQVEEQILFTPVDPVRTQTGFDMANKGLNQATYLVRGVRGVNSTALRVLHDNRWAAMPNMPFNMPYLIPTGSDDIERIELVRGAAAALYGPNADRGVLHIITRSPFDSRGTSISLVGGERSVLQGSLRQAGLVGERLAYKISANYFRGDDWVFIDSVEVRNREAAIEDGADPDTLLVGARDFDMEQVNGEARLDWRPNENTTVIGSGGIAWVASTIEITPAGGGVQLRDWRYWFLQARLSYKRLFANLFLNRNGAGDTYILRTGQRIVDDSWQLGGRMHHGSEIGQRLSLLYGIDFQHTVPRTGGTTNGRFEDDDEWTELGGYLHTATVLSPKFDLIVASRVDHHSRLNDLAFSPRVALVYKPAPAHALRLTYNRAFGKPGSLSHDILAGSLRPFGLPYDARKISTPEDGWNFRRDCGGLCMRSPFHDDPNQYLAADAALVWDAVVQLLQEQGVDLSGLPAPDATQVASELRVLNPATLEFDPVDESDVRDIPGPARRITNSLETGYKGVIGGRLFLTVDAWYTRVANFNAAQAIVTPNVFFQEASLADYLSGFMPADQARQLAASIAQIPLGTVTPQEALDPVDLLLDAAVGGALDRWGLDLYAEAQLTDVFFVGGNYSWVDRDSVPVPGITNRILGAPKNKGSLWVDYRNDRLGLTAGLRGRAVSSFPLKNGVYQGRVAAYEVLDLSVGYRLPPARNILLTLTAYNVLDDRHQEMVGAPELGRLLVTRLRVGF